MWEPNGPDLSVATWEWTVLFCVGLNVLLQGCEGGRQSLLQRQVRNGDGKLSVGAREEGGKLV